MMSSGIPDGYVQTRGGRSARGKSVVQQQARNSRDIGVSGGRLDSLLQLYLFATISNLVQEGSVYDPVKRVWIWHYDDGEQQLDFVVENGELIRFRVVALQYNRVESSSSLPCVMGREQHGCDL